MTFYKKSEKKRNRKKKLMQFSLLKYIHSNIDGNEKEIGRKMKKYVGLFKNWLKFFELIKFLKSEKNLKGWLGEEKIEKKILY